MATDDATTPTTGIYEPLSPPYQQLTDTNRGPLVLLTATTLIILTSLTVCVKLHMMFAQIRKLRWDDFAMITAMLFAIGYTLTICESVQHGLGRTADVLDASQYTSLSQNYYASNILLIFSLAFAKASVILLIIAIKPVRWVMLASWGVLGFVAVWAVASVFVVALQCGPTRWILGPTQGETCINQYAAQIAIRAVDIVIDIAIIVLPAFMMSKVQVSNSKRWAVILLFGLRIVTPIFTAISTAKLANFYSASLSDRPYYAVIPSIWTTATLNVSIITACIPSIKRFLADWAAGLSNGHIAEAFELQNSSNKSQMHSQTYEEGTGFRSALSKKFGSSSRSQKDRDATGTQTSYLSRKGREPQRDRADTSDSVEGLTDGVIMQTVDYTVEYEDHPSHDGQSNSSSRGRHMHAMSKAV